MYFAFVVSTVIFVNFVHLLNTNSPIDITDVGIVTSVIPLVWNAYDPIVVIVDGIDIVSSFSNELNAFFPIVVTLSSILIVWIFVLCDSHAAGFGL